MSKFMEALTKRRVLLFSSVLLICVAASAYLRSPQLGTGKLPTIVERRPSIAPPPPSRTIPPPSGLATSPPTRVKASSTPGAKVEAQPNGGTIYTPTSKADWESWKKAVDPSIPTTEIFVASAIKLTNVAAQIETDGTVALGDTRELEVTAWFDLAKDIKSIPPHASIQLVQFVDGRRRIIKMVKVEPLEVAGQRRSLQSTVTAPNSGNFVLILRVSGRDVADLKVRIN